MVSGDVSGGSITFNTGAAVLRATLDENGDWDFNSNDLNSVGSIDIDNITIDGNDITSTSGNINVTPNSTLVLDGLNWPTSDGTTGQVIQTNGSGQLSFIDQTSDGPSFGTDDQIPVMNAGGTDLSCCAIGCWPI